MIDTVLKDLLSSGVVSDESGKNYELHSSISPEEGNFLRTLIRDNGFNNTLEIGCAYGISSLYICHGLTGRENPHHILIDPYESTYWHNIGVHNLEKAGVSIYELIEEPSEIALPALVKANQKIDFAFIDGNHTFENVFIDFFFIDQLLKPDGIVVFHDAVWYSVKSALQKIIYHYPNYTAVGSVEVAKIAFIKRILSLSKLITGSIVRLFPEKITREFFNESLLIKPVVVTERNLALIAFKKTSATLPLHSVN